MDKRATQDIIDEALRVGEQMNLLAAAIERIEDHGERKDLRKQFANIAGMIYTDIMRPIFIQHPELDPDRKNS